MLKVGEADRVTGLSVKTLHHYEQQGLAKPAGRTQADTSHGLSTT
ncbi:MAG: MerR family DNA-binding transcriptional regulator, partial [Actinomycetota bacterium]|nr:MerR family DNA-binding transcriptional regulator [Actinomycetota bacterium]